MHATGESSFYFINSAGNNFKSFLYNVEMALMLHGANVGHFSNGDVTVVASGYFLLCGFSVSPDNRYLGILISYVIAIHVNCAVNTKSRQNMYMYDISHAFCTNA